MRLLTPEENRFLDVFLHEATTAPFTGQRRKPSTKVASSTATSRTLRGLTSRRSPGPASVVGHAADVGAAAPLAEPTIGTAAKPGNPANLGAATTRTSRSRWARMKTSEFFIPLKQVSVPLTQ